MENESLKKVVAAMLFDTQFDSCQELCKSLTSILSDLTHDLDMIGAEYKFNEIKDCVISVLPILHDEYIDDNSSS